MRDRLVRRNQGDARAAPASRVHVARLHQPHDDGRAIFQREGEYWTIVYDGVGVRLHDAKGLRYLATLLSHPGRRVPAAELAAAADGGLRQSRGVVDAATAVRHPSSTADERARSAVSKRIKGAIEKIAHHHPTLGYHLSTAVKTGYACVYRAHPGRPVAWQT